MCCHTLTMIAQVLGAVGALNWGLVGCFNFNLVTALCSALGLKSLEKVIYCAVGVAGLYLLLGLVTGGDPLTLLPGHTH